VATLYGWEELENNETLIICEGEMDRIILCQNGIPAITSTSGAGTFKKEWADLFASCDLPLRNLYVCFDNDSAGDTGAKKVIELFDQLNMPIDIYQINLPKDNGVKDVTDYFLKGSGNVDDLFSKYCMKIKDIPKIEKIQSQSQPMQWQNYSSSDAPISDSDVDEARKVHCKNFLKIEKEENGRFWAKSPWSEDKTPSLCCYEDQSRGYYDFSTGEGGDVIRLVEKLNNVDFKEAVRIILNK
jgi:DNA primase